MIATAAAAKLAARQRTPANGRGWGRIWSEPRAGLAVGPSLPHENVVELDGWPGQTSQVFPFAKRGNSHSSVILSVTLKPLPPGTGKATRRHARKKS